MHTLAISNGKGGVGKTSIAVNLAAGLAQLGFSTLGVDLDSQAHMTEWLAGRAVVDDGVSAFEPLTTGVLRGPIPEIRPKLSLLHGTVQLSAADTAIQAGPGGSAMLGEALDTVKSNYDYCIIDCPPNLGPTVWSAFVASDGILAPVEASLLAISGLRQLEAVVRKCQKHLGARAAVIGYILFGADSREGVTEATRQALHNEDRRLLTSEIRLATQAKLLPGSQMTSLDPGSPDTRGAQDYAALLDEVLLLIRGKKGHRHA